MRTLDRYVVREFVSYLAMAIGLFIGLFIVVDLFEKIDKFVDNQAATIHIVKYYVYGVPYTVVLTLPIAMLLAVLMVVGQLGRTGELVSMLSAGVSYFRIMLPVFLLSLLVSGGCYLLAELILPEALEMKEVIYEEHIRKRSRKQNRKRHVTYVGLDDRLYYVKTVDPGRGVLRDVVVQQFGPDRELVSRIDAREASHSPPYWHFRSGYLRRGVGDDEITTEFRNLWMTAIREEPDVFMNPEPEPMNMGRTELGRYIDRLRQSGARTRKYEVNFHLKLAYPLINTIIVLLGASLSVRIRRSGWALGLGLSMFIGFAYYAFIRFGQALGYAGAVPPALAAWLGNLVFLTVAMGFQLRANR